MKNKYISFVALAAAALATSCASDDLAEQKQEQNEPRTVTLTASVNDAQTRVGMTKDGSKASFYWHKDDAISVLTKGGFVKFTTTDADGTQQATFTGEVATGTTVSKYAIYPYNENNNVSNSKFYCYLSAEYDYDKVESNIFSKTENGNTTYPANPTNMPMLGTVADGKISFKCMGGLAVIRIDKMPAEKGTLTVSADQQLSGKFSINYSTPSISTTSTNVSDTDKKVTFTFSGASTTSANVFYLPLATGTYTNLKIVIAYGENNATTQTIPYGSLTMERAHVTAIPLSTDSKGNLRYIVKNEDGTYTINGHTFVDLGQDILWAKVNIGATLETESGEYYTWTEAQNHIWAACRLPTLAEIETLEKAANITWTWTTEGSVNGYKVTKKDSDNNGGSIFFPAAGFKSNSTLNTTANYYWSSTPHETTSGHYGALNFTSSGNPSTIYPDGNVHAPVRLVAEKP